MKTPIPSTVSVQGPTIRARRLRAALVLSGVLVAGPWTGTLTPRCLAQTPGAKRWVFHSNTTGWVRTCPGIGADGTVYFGSDDGKVYAVDGATGAKRWEFGTGGAVVSSPAIGADGAVFIGSDDGRVYALEGATGVRRWAFATGGAVRSAPALGTSGAVFVGSLDHKVYALDAGTGTKRWEFATGGEVYSSPAVGVSETVYFGSYDARIYAVDGATGSKRWEFLTGGGTASSPAIGTDGTVYIGSSDTGVYALDGATGAKRWEVLTPTAVTASPAIGPDGTVYVASGWPDSGVYALDGVTGARRWRSCCGDISSPAVGADGTVYLGSRGSLTALDGTTGAERWGFAGGGLDVWASPAIGADGTVYIGTWKGNLYALWSGSQGGLADSPWPKFHQNARNTGRTPGFAPRITSQPQDATGAAGASVTLTVLVTGSAPFNYQWRFNGAALSGATHATLALTNLQFPQAGAYSVTVSNAFGIAMSRSATLEVTVPLAAATEGGGALVIVPSGPYYYLSNTVVQVMARPLAGWTLLGWSGDAEGTAPTITLTMDTGKSVQATFGTPINTGAALGGTVSGYLDGARYPYGAVVTLQAQADTGFEFVRWSDGVMSQTRAVNVTNLIALQPVFAALPQFTLTGSVLGGAGGTVVRQPDQESYYRDTAVTLIARPGPGHVFQVWLDNVLANPRTIVMTSNVTLFAVFASGEGQPPKITAGPQDATVVVGAQVRLTVAAQGSTPLEYQWRHDGRELPGATAATYTIAGAQPGDAGAYAVVVRSGASAVTNPPVRVSVQASPDLVGDWRLNEADGNTAWDQSGHGHHGVVAGGSGADWPGGTLRFDGARTFVDIPSDSSLNFAGPITLSAWVRPESLTELQNIVVHGNGVDPPAEVGLRLYLGYYQAASWNGLQASGTWAPIPPGDLGSWVHLAGVYDGGKWLLYRHGVLLSSDPGPFGALPVNAPWAIGAQAGGGGRCFTGAIAGVRVYNRALAVAELAQLAAPQLRKATETVWVGDALPPGAVPEVAGDDDWTWVSEQPAPFAGQKAHRSNLAVGLHQHWFWFWYPPDWRVDFNDTLVNYVYLDPTHPPRMVMVQWSDGAWDHRAYWGEEKFSAAVPGLMPGTPGLRFMGQLPPAGQWVRLTVPATLVGLEQRTVVGMAFTLFDGQAWWDNTGKASPLSPPIFPRLGMPEWSPGAGFRLLLNDGQPGRNYTLQFSADLRNWTGLSTNRYDGPSLGFLDGGAATFNYRYYRVRLSE